MFIVILDSQSSLLYWGYSLEKFHYCSFRATLRLVYPHLDTVQDEQESDDEGEEADDEEEKENDDER